MQERKITVVAARPGLKVPREDSPRRYIEQEPLAVPRSSYYLRQLASGDLREVVAPIAPPPAAAAAPVAPIAPHPAPVRPGEAAPATKEGGR